MAGEIDKDSCEKEGGVWKRKQCKFGEFSDVRKEIHEKRVKRAETIQYAKQVSRSVEGRSKQIASRFQGKKIIPQWVITLIVLTVFTVVFYMPVLGIISALVTSIALRALLGIWAKDEVPGDKELNIVFYAFFFLIWVATAQVSFANVSVWKLLIAGLIIDVLNAIPMLLKNVIDTKWISYISGAIAFFIVYLFIGGLEGIIISAIAGMLAMLITIPSFIPRKPYFLPVMTVILLAIKYIADYISKLFEAIM